jgi:hypothetical protein
MSLFTEEPASKLQTIYTGTKHAARSAGYACARLAHLPLYRFATATVPLPGDLRRIYFYHVRKTGGTTFAHAFLALGGEDPGVVERRMKHPPFCTASGAYRFAYQDPPLLRRGYYFFGYGHKPAELIRLPDQTFTVTILRDPVDRVVSLYRYLADPQADEGQTFHALDGERDWARSSFGHFLDRVPRLQLLNQLYMFSLAGSVPEAAERIARCDRVLLTKDLDRGLGEVAAFLRRPLAIRRVRESRFAYWPSDSEAARLRELLEPEYQLLSLVTRPAGEAAPGAVGPSASFREARAATGELR